MKRRKTLLSTNIRVYLSLNVQARKDNGEIGLFALPLLSLTTVLLWWWNLQTIINQISWKMNRYVALIQTWFDTWQQQLSLAQTLFEIGMRSALYGIGLTA